jgi:hypothetical protein
MLHQPFVIVVLVSPQIDISRWITAFPPPSR